MELCIRRIIIAPCQKDGEIRSNWPYDPEVSMLQDFEDDEDKVARCKCSSGECCVDGKNHVIEGPAFNFS